MTWYYVPSACAPVSEASTSAWPPGVAPWVMSSGTLSPRPSSWPGWKTRPWIARLSGLTFEPSTLERGVARWISSQAATRASHSASPDDDSATPTSDTCGLTSHESSTNPAPRLGSSRTSPGTFRLGSPTSLPTLPRSGSMRSGVCCARPMSERRTDASGSSSWPTATSTDAKSSGAAGYSTESGRHSGTTLTDAMLAWEKANGVNRRSSKYWEQLERAERLHGPSPYQGRMGDKTTGIFWPTPNAHDGRRPGADLKSTQGANLSRDAALRNTPRVGTHGQPGARATATGDALEPQAQRWAKPAARDWKSDDPSQSPEHSPPLGRQVLRTETAGSDGSGKAVLNPSFVEALMGFPPSWTVPTVSARSATPSSQPKRAPRSLNLRGGY